MKKALVSLLALLGLGLAGITQADEPQNYEPRATPVVDNVYAIVGPITGRTAGNDALNNNLGFVVTDTGVVLIDSGASRLGAKQIDAAIDAVTDQPVTHVINTGSQDHRWLGNAWFAEQGAEIIALKRTVETQRRFADQHVARLEEVLGERFAGTEPMPSADPIDADRKRLEIGGTTFELIWFGDAHFPGDIVVWLPERETVFTGDMVYVDRMLGIHPWSDVLSWQGAFHEMETLEAKHVVPGHGQVTDMAQARAEAGDYLDFLVAEIRTAVDNFEGLQATVDRLTDAPRFKHLEHFDNWHRTNISRAYTQIEAAAMQ
ncbi:MULTISPECIES: MBL fold metallo-hydrolase [unclassified Guyparkeria]|uniref:MBL fold metallo-hydrolase n=1 Tax=unclassified Guyparkeria TaxID=2626246 RepID=UPI0007338E4C|nr:MULTISPECIES: MBL fold metallo-hydrolase [unclassified Guyparkeria]KTG16877.1 MBL fold metallo-hydrolase [Guyparkeria sp. XI15]OAE85911.1 MBL fold metallo-hydrolase [Guyparkeria sp. WRN-7]